MLRNCVYRFLNFKNEVIYIGKAKNLKQRLASHNHLPDECYKERVSIEFTMFSTEDEMDFAERYYIPKYKPKYNTMMNKRCINIDIAELDNKRWLTIENYEKKQLKNELFRIKMSEIMKERAKEKAKQKELEKQLSRKVICVSTGEIFENIKEFKTYMNAFNGIEELLKVASGEDVFLGIHHPKYEGVIATPKFIEVFNSYDEQIKINIKEMQITNTRKIICITTGEIFMNKYEASNKFNIDKYRIERNCNNLSRYAGTLDDKPLVWKWYDEYINMSEEEIREYMSKAFNTHKIRNKAS